MNRVWIFWGDPNDQETDINDPWVLDIRNQKDLYIINLIDGNLINCILACFSWVS